MERTLTTTALAVAIACLAGCGGQQSSANPAAGEQKGQFGSFYLVSVSRPVGGTISSGDGKIDCGAVGTHDLCGPARFDWGQPATLSAFPDAGQFFQSWAGDCSGSVASGGCVLNTVASGADKWVAAVFNPPGKLGHSYIPDPAQHGPLFNSFLRKDLGAPLCNTCHGANYDGLANAPSCNACHAKAGHGDWLTDCSFCHGNPPATGAHAAHFGLTNAQTSGAYGDLAILQDRYPGATPTSAPGVYAFGCGHCHPATDQARHMDGVTQVALFEASAPAGTLKARSSATAIYDPATKACSGVYCHSSGQESPAFVDSPGWNSGAHLGCDGCHRNPPRYVSSGPGTAGGNSHFGLNIYGEPWGHVAGLPAPSVGIFKHGGWYGGGPGSGTNSSMVSCQTCHFDTTNPSNTGPSGFYYLDTTVGVDGTALGGWEGVFSCVACHTPGSQTMPTRPGKVLPLRHVNGSREVRFDPRTSLPAFDWLPIPPNRPTKPYWFTVSSGVAEWDRTIVSWTRPPLGGTSGATAQFNLTSARYDSGTKTCTNVACHMSQGSTNFNPGGPVPLEPPRIPLVWGDVYYGNPWTCAKCHALDPAFAY